MWTNRGWNGKRTMAMANRTIRTGRADRDVTSWESGVVHDRAPEFRSFRWDTAPLQDDPVVFIAPSHPHAEATKLSGPHHRGAVYRDALRARASPLRPEPQPMPQQMHLLTASSCR
jgi:hypothetical protein